MKTFSKYLNSIERLPEYYLILVALLASYTPPFHFNAIGTVCLVLATVQIITRNKVGGIVISSLCLLVNLLFLMAVVSEFNDFRVMNTKARELLGVGLSIFCINLLMSLSMLNKYLRMIQFTWYA